MHRVTNVERLIRCQVKSSTYINQVMVQLLLLESIKKLYLKGKVKHKHDR